MKCKWVFKIKRNGIFHARLVACGYSQIPGVDFTENYSPVINDITFRVLLVISMLNRHYKNVLVDVETAFLHGDLEEEIFMECPEGMKAGRDECLRLNKTIYGLVQSARQFFKKLTEVLKKIGFEGGDADPCLLTRRKNNKVVHVALYVDDCLCCGDPEAIAEVIKLMKEHGFTVKVETK